MAENRTLKLGLLADTSNFVRGMNKAGKESETFSNKIAASSKKAAQAFAVVGVAAAGMAVKLGVDAVKAAMEDQKSARILEVQLQKTVKANDKMVASVEDYISATQLRVGVQDDKLRPSFARLVRSTKDVAKAQDLMNLALDISSATGKDLETVTAALGKAQDGNAASLGRLGLGIDANILKSKDFNKITDVLKANFKGFADKEANTLDGKFRKLRITSDELKEQIGYALLPKVQELADKAVRDWAPKLQGLVDALTGIKNSAGTAGQAGYDMGEKIKNVIKFIKDNQGTLEVFGKSIAAAFLVGKAMTYATTLASGLSLIRAAFVKTTAVAATTATAEAAATGGGSLLAALPAMAALAAFFGTAIFSYSPDTLSKPEKAAQRRGQAAAGAAAGSGRPSYRGGYVPQNLIAPSTNITINGAVDANGTRRQIEQLLKTSARSMGQVNLVGNAL
jgi:hypothetical protein